MTKKKSNVMYLDTSKQDKSVINYNLSPFDPPGISFKGSSLNPNGTINPQMKQETLKFIFNNATASGFTNTTPLNFYAYKIVVYCDGNAGAIGRRVYITRQGSTTHELSTYSIAGSQNFDFLCPALFLGKEFYIDMPGYPSAGVITVMIYGWIE
jgi:hypothetical protein